MIDYDRYKKGAKAEDMFYNVLKDLNLSFFNPDFVVTNGIDTKKLLDYFNIYAYSGGGIIKLHNDLAYYHDFQTNFIDKFKRNMFLIEVKNKQHFPHNTTGMDEYQYQLRKELYKKYGIDTLLVTYNEKEYPKYIFMQWISNLINKTRYAYNGGLITAWDLHNFYVAIKVSDDV